MASEILREQFLGFQMLSGEVQEAAVVVEETDFFEGHDMPIEQLQLSVRAYNCLKRSGLMTVGAVLEKSEEELLALRNFGEKSYFELKEKLVTAGFPAPRTDGHVEGAEDAMVPAAVGVEAPAAAEPEAEADDDEVGALGAALMEALKEAGRESN
jgi:DNA-directed RNA polymerase subunit alpha